MLSARLRRAFGTARDGECGCVLLLVGPALGQNTFGMVEQGLWGCKGWGRGFLVLGGVQRLGDLQKGSSPLEGGQRQIPDLAAPSVVSHMGPSTEQALSAGGIGRVLRPLTNPEIVFAF